MSRLLAVFLLAAAGTELQAQVVPAIEEQAPAATVGADPAFPVPPEQDSTVRAPWFRPKVVVHREVVIPKDPFLAGALSLVLPGTGQAYCGKWFKGIAFLLGSQLSYALAGSAQQNDKLEPEAKNLISGVALVLGLVVHGWSVIDGVNAANTHNQRLLEAP